MDEAHLDALDAIFERDRIASSEQVRRAVEQWCEQRGVPVKLPPRTHRRRTD